MTDNEIIKAKAHFEYGIKCDIFKEPVLSYAKTVLEAFDEINRQKAEIERLEKGSLKEAMIFNSKTIENATAEAIKECLDKFDIEYCKMFSIPEIEFMKAFKRCFLEEMVGEE